MAPPRGAGSDIFAGRMIEGPQDRGWARRIRGRRRGGRRIAAVLFVALLAAAAWYTRDLWQRPAEPAEEAALPPSEPAAAPAAPEQAAAAVAEPLVPAQPLPALDESDAYARERAAAVSSRPELAKWLAGE